MVSSTTRKISSFAISLLAVVISLTAVAQAASIPNVAKLSRYTPGFAGAPGKMARDAAGNFYVADFWGRGIMKLDRQGVTIGFISTNSRPTAVAVLPNSNLVVAMAGPSPYVAIYSQTAGELAQLPSTPKLYRPVAVAVDNSSPAPNIYVLDSGDTGAKYTSPDWSVRIPKVRVYDSATTNHLYAFGARNTYDSMVSAVAGQFSLPLGLRYDKQGNRIVIVDTLNARLQFYTAYNGASCDPVTTLNPSGLSTHSIGKKLMDSEFTTGEVMLGDPTDVDFEYSGSKLYRLYVTDRSRNEIVVVDAESTSGTYTRELKRISATTVTGADMQYPSAVLFEKTTTGGVLYTNNAPTSLSANILALGIDSGTVPVPNGAITINPAVPATVTVTPLASLGGTVSPSGATVTCSANGDTANAKSVVATGTSWSLNGQLALNNGDNYILCQSDNGSITNYQEAKTYYALSTTGAPTVGISQPVNGTYTSSATATVSGTLTGTNYNNATVQLVDSLGGTWSTMSDASGNYSATVTLLEGANVITVSAWKPGSATGSNSVTVNADFTNPTMSVSSLRNTDVTNAAVQNVDGFVTESNLASITVNGVAVPAAAQLDMGGSVTYFSAPVTLMRGSSTVTVVATDKVGKTATFVRTPTLNPELAPFAVAAPADNAYMTGVSSAAGSGTSDVATYTAVGSIDAAGQQVTPSGGNWSTPSNFTVYASLNPYYFTATGGGKTVALKRTILNSASYPQLSINSPAADLAVNSATQTISGSVAIGSSTPQISLNGSGAVNVTTYNSGTGAFSHSVTLVPGLNTIKVTRTGSPTATAIRNIIYDNVAPDMSIQADAKPMPSTISGNMEPSARMGSITASLSGSGVVIPMSVFTYDAYDPATGFVVWHAYLSGYNYDTISFTSTDPAGNSKTIPFVSTGKIPTGDVDGDGTVRLADALLALRSVAGTQTLTADQAFQADVGDLVGGKVAQDGNVDISDAVLILDKAYGLLNF